MTKTPAYSLLPFRTHLGNRSLRSSTGRCFPELVLRKPPAAPRLVRWTLIAKASGLRFGRFSWCPGAPREDDLHQKSIWIPYRPLSLEPRGPSNLSQFSRHRLATPVSPWERLKIGCGTPPVLTRHGWLIVYYGVSETEGPSHEVHPLCSSAGVMVLSKEHPQVIRYRSSEPVLTPELPQ